MAMGLLAALRRMSSVDAPEPTPRVITAQHYGGCQACGYPIEIGDPIAQRAIDDGRVRWVHYTCP